MQTDECGARSEFEQERTEVTEEETASPFHPPVTEGVNIWPCRSFSKALDA